MTDAQQPPADQQTPPSNAVYARVGEAILQAARTGVERHRTPQEIIQDIAAEHSVHLNVGELRLLLASRRPPK
jgi:hypothetical protein